MYNFNGCSTNSSDYFTFAVLISAKMHVKILFLDKLLLLPLLLALSYV